MSTETKTKLTFEVYFKGLKENRIQLPVPKSMEADILQVMSNVGTVGSVYNDENIKMWLVVSLDNQKIKKTI